MQKNIGQRGFDTTWRVYAAIAVAIAIPLAAWFGNEDFRWDVKQSAREVTARVEQQAATAAARPIALPAPEPPAGGWTQPQLVWRQHCEVSGTARGWGLSNTICDTDFGRSVHGTTEPVNMLTIAVTRHQFASITLQHASWDREAFERMMFAVLEKWLDYRGVKVGRVELFYGKVHLVTVATRIFGGPSLTYHTED